MMRIGTVFYVLKVSIRKQRDELRYKTVCSNY